MSQTRRSRFTVNLLAPGGVERTVVILGYGPQNVIDHYNAQGIAVVGIKRGDYRKAATPPAPSGPRLRLSAKALKEARAFLEIAAPIDLHFNSRNGNTRGNHRSMPVGLTGWKHRIMVKAYLTPEQASRTLWHELAHGMQFERDIIALGLPHRESIVRWNRAYRDGTTYRNKPYEVEARTYEAYADEMPLFVG